MYNQDTKIGGFLLEQMLLESQKGCACDLHLCKQCSDNYGRLEPRQDE